MKKLILNLSLLTLMFITTGEAFAQAWDSYNNPSNFFRSYEARITKLKVASNSQQKVWTGFHWPNFSGGIAMRWDQSIMDYTNPPVMSNPHNYRTLNRNTILSMSTQELNQLSAAEKYDIYKRRYDLPTLKLERERTSPQDPSWEGMCNGWSAAAIKFDQPESFNHILENGVSMTFYSKDVKALLTFYEFNYNGNSSAFLGLRCNNNPNDPGCHDINPGTLHILLGNQIGIQRKSLIMDVDGGPEVWNHPIFAYDSTVTKIGRGLYNAKTIIWLLQESAPVEYPLANPPILGKHFEYNLNVDNYGRITGGTWISREMPDFAWLPSPIDFTKNEYYSAIQEIYKKSQNGVRRPYVLGDIVRERFYNR